MIVCPSEWFPCPLCHGRGAELKYDSWGGYWEPCICEEGYVTAEQLEQIQDAEEMWDRYLKKIGKGTKRI